DSVDANFRPLPGPAIGPLHNRDLNPTNGNRHSRGPDFLEGPAPSAWRAAGAGGINLGIITTGLRAATTCNENNAQGHRHNNEPETAPVDHILPPRGQGPAFSQR